MLLLTVVLMVKSKEMRRFILVSTKTTLKTLFEAVENVERETGVKIDLGVIYAHTHDLDKLDPAEVVSRGF